MARKKKAQRRSPYQGSVIVRKDGRLEVRYWLRNPFDQFERHIVTLPAGTPPAAGQAMLDRINAERDAGDLRLHDRETVEQWLRRWLREIIAPDKKPKTVDVYEWAIGHIVPHIGRLELRALEVRHVRALKAELGRTIRPNGKPLARTTIALVLCTLRTALAAAVRDQLLRENVATLVPIGAPEASETVPPTPEQARLILHQFEGHPLQLFYELAMYRGLRSGEIRAITRNRVNLARRELEIVGTLYQKPRMRPYIVTPKSRRGRRVVPLSDELVEAFRERFIQQDRDRLKAGGVWENDLGLVFTTDTGKPVWASTMLQWFKKACAAAGVPQATVHSLRHAANTIMAAEGIDEATRMALLGQKSSLVNKLYSHTTPERVADAAGQLERKLREA